MVELNGWVHVKEDKMISWLWLLLIFPVSWFMFFLGVCMEKNGRHDEWVERNIKGK